MLRLEVIRGEDGRVAIETALSFLLDRSGKGWTFAVTDATTVVYQPWGEHWREYHASFARALMTLTRVFECREQLADLHWADGLHPLTVSQQNVDRPRWVTAGQERDAGVQHLRLEVDFYGNTTMSPDAEMMLGNSRSSLRQENCQRGLGRGGVCEVWSVWRIPAAGTTGWTHRISSSRRPGDLEVSVPRIWNVEFPYPEAFLPVWSLAELLQW
ncbi:MAG: hypothetical protein ABIF77_21270 [bacterium]